jgi:hypothetical protein
VPKLRLDAKGVSPDFCQSDRTFCCCWWWWGFFLSFPLLYLVFLTLLLLFSHLYSYPLHFLSFSYATIHCFCPNYSFCPFSSTLFPQLHSPSLSSPITSLALSPPHLPPADQPTVPNIQNPISLQSLTQAPFTMTAELYSNIYKSPKTL